MDLKGSYLRGYIIGGAIARNIGREVAESSSALSNPMIIMCAVQSVVVT